MINLHDSYEDELGFELVTPVSAVNHATDCVMEPGSEMFQKSEEAKYN